MATLVPSHSLEMFSAASFGSVVAGGRPTAPSEELAPMSGARIVAFYGYRGGAGRTTALGWYAAHLCARQKRVVAVDLDLEAPGLVSTFGCELPESNVGALALLRTIETTDPGTDIDVRSHLLTSSNPKLGTLDVLPAGRVDRPYLMDLDDLGVALWHTDDGGSPLSRLLEAIERQMAPDVILIDCRTGLSGLSASALFHSADVVVNLFTATRQSLEGIEVFLDALKSARQNRGGRPSVLLVPSMIAGDPESRSRLATDLLPSVDELHEGQFSDDLFREGVSYAPEISVCDGVRDGATFATRIYGELFRDLDVLLEPTEQSTSSAQVPALNCSSVLTELRDSNLSRLAFAEEVTPDEIKATFIVPSQFQAILQARTAYIVGGKGAGKTWFWTYLTTGTEDSIPGLGKVVFVAPFGPKSPKYPRALVQAIFNDQSTARAKLGSFWRLVCLAETFEKSPVLREPTLAALPAEGRVRLGQVLANVDDQVGYRIRALLNEPEIDLWSDQALRALDGVVASQQHPAVVWAFDGLDSGFAYGEEQQAFSLALILMLEEYRGPLKHIYFKVFIREDLYHALQFQNRSHLEAARTFLSWSESDLWGLALNLVSRSETYKAHLKWLSPRHHDPGDWPREEAERRALLDPLWGAQIERGNKSSTANWIARRTTDGKGRLFPRTLVQLLAYSVDAAPDPKDRVLPSAAIQTGYAKASEQRVTDLSTEYVRLKPYLDALKGKRPVGTRKEFEAYWESAKLRTEQDNDPFQDLVHVGVLAEYKRSRSDTGQPKYQIALLYRPGLSIKSGGV